MHKILKKFTYLSMATASLALFAGPTTHASQKSERDKTFTSHNFTKNDGWQKRLATDGYSFKLTKDNDGVWKNLAGEHNQKITTKDLKNENFKIDQIWSYKNGMSYKVSSQSNKYSGWVDAVFVYNSNRNNEKLKPIIQLEQKVIDNANEKIYPDKSPYYQVSSSFTKSDQKNLAKATKEANQLKGNTKKAALASIEQTKNYAKEGTGNYSSLPSLLWWT